MCQRFSLINGNQRAAVIPIKNMPQALEMRRPRGTTIRYEVFIKHSICYLSVLNAGLLLFPLTNVCVRVT